MRRRPLFHLFKKADSIFLPITQKSNKLQKKIQDKKHQTNSEYALVLRHLQAFRSIYGYIKLKTLKHIAKNVGKTLFIGHLERRADVLLYRSSFAPSLWAARQLVHHGHVQVNANTLKASGYTLKPGDILSVHKPMNHKTISTKVPTHIQIDYGARRLILLSTPQSIDYPAIIDFNLVWKGLNVKGL